MFRQYRQLGDNRSCDLEAILAEDQIDLVRSREKDPGYTACLLRNPYGPGGGIWIAPGQDRGRERFSIAHELGHFHIPSHARKGGELEHCADGDMRARNRDARVVEWEANDFAAELLMPMKLFASDVQNLDVSFASVQRLAGESMYNVSLTAAAWRFIQASRERCAMVVSSAGRVEWIVRSEGFFLPLTERSQQLSADALAASVFRGEGTDQSPREVPGGAWLDRPTQLRGTLYESTHHVPRFDQVISLLWHCDDEAEDAN